MDRAQRQNVSANVSSGAVLHLALLVALICAAFVVAVFLYVALSLFSGFANWPAFGVLFALVNVQLMVIAVLVMNRLIGATYRVRAADLKLVLSRVPRVFQESGVRSQAVLRYQPFGFSVHASPVDVTVTSRAIYLVQSVAVMGQRYPQPIIGITLLADRMLDDGTARLTVAATLTETPVVRGNSVELKGTLGSGTFTWVLRVGDPSAFLNATRSPPTA